MKHLQLQSSPISFGSFLRTPKSRADRRVTVVPSTQDEGGSAARGIVNALALSAFAWLLIIAVMILL